MKLPSVLFVKHCPPLTPERKTFLESYLPDRVPINDVRWLEDYNYDHPFVEWINQRYNLPYGTKLTSNMVKTLSMFQTMIDENIESVIMMDDDALLHKDWVEIFESVNLPSDIMFVNMGLAPWIPYLKPEKGTAYRLQNNGGCEVCWFSIDFAKKFLENINMDHAIDIIFHGFLSSVGHPLISIPVCTQTSGLLRNSSLDHDTRKEIVWQQYVQIYKQLPKVTFSGMKKEYKEFLELKTKKEHKLYELYGMKIDVKNVKWIMGNSPDYCNNIV